MLIQKTSQFDLAAAYQKTISHERSESLRAWKNGNSVEISSRQNESVSLSAAARWSMQAGASDAGMALLRPPLAAPGAHASPQQAAAGLLQGATRLAAPTPPPTAPVNTQSSPTDNVENVAEETEDSPKIALIRRLIEMISGQKVEVFSARDLEKTPAGEVLSGDKSLQEASQEAAQNANWGAVYEARERYEEHESSAFRASGTVRTADGRDIAFSLELNMSSHFVQESSFVARFGQATKDPLVINFSGGAAQLTDQFFKFDLKGDGQEVNIAALASGSAYLYFDRNQDGIVNNGTELFGPSTDNGFAELAALDADANGWIDEADPAFAQLGVWRMAANGESQYSSLKDAGIGALALAHLATPTNLRSNTMQLLGNVRSSGVALTEDGRPLALQQIDLVVR